MNSSGGTEPGCRSGQLTRSAPDEWGRLFMDANSSITSFQLRLLAVVLVVCVGLLFWAAASAVLVVFMGVLLGSVFTGGGHIVQRFTRLSYRWSFGLMMLVLVVTVTISLYFLAPTAAEQMHSLREELPAAWEKLQERFVQSRWGGWVVDHSEGSSNLMPEGRTLMYGAAGVFTTSIGVFTAFVAALFIGIFLAIEPAMYVTGVVLLFPQARRARVREVLHQLGHVLRQWFFAKSVSMAIVGVLTGVGLALLGIPLPVPLAILASLLTFIPNVGPVIAAVPAVLLGVVETPQTGAYVALLYVGVQAVESYGITPFVERETVSLPPAVTLTAQLVFGLIAGFAGVIVATPLAAVLIVLVQTLYVQDLLGDRDVESIAQE